MSDKYAVVRIKGRQYKVKEEEEILVDKVEKEPSCEVLLVVDGEKVSIGKPLVSQAKVMLKKMGEEKGEKVDVYKYTAKSRYRKHIGFRPQFTKLLVEKIQ